MVSNGFFDISCCYLATPFHRKYRASNLYAACVKFSFCLSHSLSLTLCCFLSFSFISFYPLMIVYGFCSVLYVCIAPLLELFLYHFGSKMVQMSLYVSYTHSLLQSFHFITRVHTYCVCGS